MKQVGGARWACRAGRALPPPQLPPPDAPQHARADVRRQAVARSLALHQVVPQPPQDWTGAGLAKVKHLPGRVGEVRASWSEQQQLALDGGSSHPAAAAQRRAPSPAPASKRVPPPTPNTRTWACPRLRHSTVSRRGPTRPPDFALMNTTSGVSATSGPTYLLVPTRYSAGILRGVGGVAWVGSGGLVGGVGGAGGCRASEAWITSKRPRL